MKSYAWIVVFLLIIFFIAIWIYFFKNGKESFSNGQMQSSFYVATRSFVSVCDVVPVVTRINDSDISQIYGDDFPWAERVKSKDVVYITGSSLKSFVKKCMPLIQNEFILVTGDADADIPSAVLTENEFDAFISSPKLLKCFSQNLVIKHPKMTIIPIGLDLHTLSNNKNPVYWGPIQSVKEQENILKT